MSAERAKVVALGIAQELAVRAVCPDWAELSEHQRERTREIFAAGAAWGRANAVAEIAQIKAGERK